ncbi:MAG: sigma-54-dependent transcriptional regulator, partial [Phycisphaerales bacterium]
MSRVLIVDDKEMMRDSVAATLARKGHTVIAASDGHAALEKLAKRRPDVVVTDLQMPGMDGLELLNEVRTFDEQLPVIFMTAYGTVETAVAALKRGAFDYITKPFSGDELMLAVERALEHAALLKENQILRAAARPIGKAAACNHAMIGSGECMSALITRLHMVADSHGTVLLPGESGSGKEVAAHWIHEHSPRSDAPFLAINCAALSTSL